MNKEPFQEESIDLKKLFFKYLPYWYWFVLCVIIAVAAAYLVNRFREPVYRVKSTVLIREDRLRGAGFMGELDMFATRSNWFNETAILQSHTLVDSVIRNMDVDVSYYSLGRILGSLRRNEIYTSSPFRVTWDREHPQPFGKAFTFTVIDQTTFEMHEVNGLEDFQERQRYQFGQLIQGADYAFRVDFIADYDDERHPTRVYQFIINDISRLVPAYLSALNVEPMGQGFSIVEVTFQATSLQRATDFLNILANTYIQKGLDEKNQTAVNTILFIDEQIALTSENLDMAESSLQEFRQDRQLVDMSMLATQLLGELQVLDRQRSTEQVKRQYYDFLLEYVQDARDFTEVFGPTALGIEDPLLNTLLVELSKLYSERSRLLLTTTERSPGVQAIDQNINQAKAALEETIKSVQAASGIQLSDLNRRIRTLERRINELPQTERELVSIQRIFNLSDATYNYLLEKRAEAGIALASNQPDHKVIDEARFNGMVSPKRRLNYAIALFAGLALPFLVIVMRDFFNTRVIDKTDVTNVLNLPVLGIIPH